VLPFQKMGAEGGGILKSAHFAQEKSSIRQGLGLFGHNDPGQHFWPQDSTEMGGTSASPYVHMISSRLVTGYSPAFRVGVFGQGLGFSTFGQSWALQHYARAASANPPSTFSAEHTIRTHCFGRVYCTPLC